uniref:Nanos-type domain-containing protein n=1 Tax=Macrostomum lignano TaxID=282301 RepID=A0A1I8JQX0_9PLAT
FPYEIELQLQLLFLALQKDSSEPVRVRGASSCDSAVSGSSFAAGIDPSPKPKPRCCPIGAPQQHEQLRAILQKHERRPYRPVLCVFCKKNNEPESFYRGHTVKDGNGDVVCPVLQSYECPICHATPDGRAHRQVLPGWQRGRRRQSRESGGSGQASGSAAFSATSAVADEADVEARRPRRQRVDQVGASVHIDVNLQRADLAVALLLSCRCRLLFVPADPSAATVEPEAFLHPLPTDVVAAESHRQSKVTAGEDEQQRVGDDLVQLLAGGDGLEQVGNAVVLAPVQLPAAGEAIAERPEAAETWPRAVQCWTAGAGRVQRLPQLLAQVIIDAHSLVEGDHVAGQDGLAAQADQEENAQRLRALAAAGAEDAQPDQGDNKERHGRLQAGVSLQEGGAAAELAGADQVADAAGPALGGGEAQQAAEQAGQAVPAAPRLTCGRLGEARGSCRMLSTRQQHMAAERLRNGGMGSRDVYDGADLLSCFGSRVLSSWRNSLADECLVASCVPLRLLLQVLRRLGLTIVSRRRCCSAALSKVNTADGFVIRGAGERRSALPSSRQFCCKVIPLAGPERGRARGRGGQLALSRRERERRCNWDFSSEGLRYSADFNAQHADYLQKKCNKVSYKNITLHLLLKFYTPEAALALASNIRAGNFRAQQLRKNPIGCYTGIWRNYFRQDRVANYYANELLLRGQDLHALTD